MVMMIISELADDDKAFMLKIYQDYYGLVRKTIYDITYDFGNLEDLINDTFLKLIEKLSVIRSLNSCKTAAYVVYTARSVAINFIKHRDIQRKHWFYGGDSDLSEDIPDREENIEERIIHREEIEAMGNAILRLPERQKNILFFKYILEMKDYKIAEILGIAAPSVRQYLTRARGKARKLMDKEMYMHADE